MSLIGCVDVLTDTCISGWAADEAALDRQVFVEVLLNAVPIVWLRAAVFREDLRQAGIGDGRKGFRFDPGPYLSPGRNDIEVRFAGGGPVARGQGRLARPYARVSAESAFLTVLQAYYRFRPEHHICAIGPESERLRSAVLEMQLPFREFTCVPGVTGELRLPEKADLVVMAEGSAEKARWVVDNFRDRGACLAVACPETADAEQLSGVFREGGGPAVTFDSIPPVRGAARRLFVFAEMDSGATVTAAPLLAHIHVPKCAGTSFRILLERYFGPRYLRLYIDDTYFVYSEEALRNCLLNDPEIRGFSSHHVRSFPRFLAGRRMLYVTFLRDPVEQFVSYMTHIQKHYAGITAENLLEAVPPDAPQLTLREFARWLLTHDREIPFRENHNVNFFARHSAPAAANRLEAAQEALRGFFFVGITERMEGSMRRLRALAGPAGLDLPHDPVPRENTSCDYRDDLSWIHPGDEVGALLLRSVEKDRQLYDWAAARLEQSSAGA